MTKISTDIANKVSITSRAGDSFYLKCTLSNEDGTPYNLESIYGASKKALLTVVNDNDDIVTGFTSEPTSSTHVADSISISGSELEVSVSSTQFILRKGSYGYSLHIEGNNEKNTVMYGKLKVIG